MCWSPQRQRCKARVSGATFPDDQILIAAPFVDNRNFELMVDTLAKSSAPQPTLSEAAVRALGAVAVRTTRFMRGEPIPELAMNTDQVKLNGRHELTLVIGGR